MTSVSRCPSETAKDLHREPSWLGRHVTKKSHESFVSGYPSLSVSYGSFEELKSSAYSLALHRRSSFQSAIAPPICAPHRSSSIAATASDLTRKPLLHRVLTRSVSVEGGKELQILASSASQPLFLDIDKRPDFDLVFPSSSNSIQRSTTIEEDAVSLISTHSDLTVQEHDSDARQSRVLSSAPNQSSPSYKSDRRHSNPTDLKRSVSATPLVYRSQSLRRHHQRDLKQPVFVPSFIIKPVRDNRDGYRMDLPTLTSRYYGDESEVGPSSTTFTPINNTPIITTVTEGEHVLSTIQGSHEGDDECAAESTLDDEFDDLNSPPRGRPRPLDLRRDNRAEYETYARSQRQLGSCASDRADYGGSTEQDDDPLNEPSLNAQTQSTTSAMDEPRTGGVRFTGLPPPEEDTPSRLRNMPRGRRRSRTRRGGRSLTPPPRPNFFSRSPPRLGSPIRFSNWRERSIPRPVVDELVVAAMGTNPVNMRGQLLTVTDITCPDEQGELEVIAREGLRIGGIQFGSRQIFREGSENADVPTAQHENVIAAPRPRDRRRLLSVSIISSEDDDSTPSTFVPLTPSAPQWFDDTVAMSNHAPVASNGPSTGRIRDTRQRPQIVNPSEQLYQRTNQAIGSQHSATNNITMVPRAPMSAVIEGEPVDEIQAITPAAPSEAVLERERRRLEADQILQATRPAESSVPARYRMRMDDAISLGEAETDRYHVCLNTGQRSRRGLLSWTKWKEVAKWGADKVVKAKKQRRGN